MGREVGRALQLLPLLCPSPLGLGTDRCPHTTGSGVGKASCKGDDPATARRWHLGAPGWGHPGSLLSSSKIPCPREGMGSHRGRSQGRHCAAAESEQRAIFGVLPLPHPWGTLCPGPGHWRNGAGTMEGYGNKLRSPAPPRQPPCAPHGDGTSRHPLHPVDQHAATTVLPCSCTAAGGATCARSGVCNPSQLSTAAALWCQPPRARIPTPRLQGHWCLLVSKPGPFSQREHS